MVDTPQPPASAATANAPASPGDVVARALAAAGSAGGDGGQKEQPVPDEITVDYGGTRRTLKVSDLVEAHRGRDESRQQSEVAKRLLSAYGDIDQLTQLRDRIGNLNENQRGKLIALLSGQDQDDEPQEQQDPDDPDTLLNNLPRAKPGRTQAPDPASARMDRIEGALRELANDLVGRRQESARQTAARQIEEIVAQHQDLNSQEARDYVREQVLESLRGNPNLDVGKAVGNHAKVLKGLMDASRRSLLGPTRNPTAPPTRALPEKTFKGQDLQNGKIAAAVDEVLRQLG